uniref:Keratin-associated protein 12-1-like n=1 Tax=Monodon monoceros TaxID=40151 RepID=A0A8C6AT00_MONMO
VCHTSCPSGCQAACRVPSSCQPSCCTSSPCQATGMPVSCKPVVYVPVSRKPAMCIPVSYKPVHVASSCHSSVCRQPSRPTLLCRPTPLADACRGPFCVPDT